MTTTMMQAAGVAIDAQALMALSDEELAALPEDIQLQARDLIAQVKDEAEKAEQERQNRVRELGQMVLQTYEKRIGERTAVEERWRRDIRRFNGQYEEDVKRALESRIFGSRVFIPLARRVCNIVYARLIDLLFATEERGFAVDASPVPTLAEGEALARSLPPDAEINAGGQTVTASAVAAGIAEIRNEAKERARAMEREIDDQLRQANFQAAAREAVHDAVVAGTGVLKGPIVLNRQKKVWDIALGKLSLIEDLSPTVQSVSYWDFFPDMTARRLRDSESEIERHYLTKAQLAKLATQPGFNKDAIRNALKTEPGHRRENDRQGRSESTTANDPRYLMLEYHGPVDAELLEDMGISLPEDPLITYEAVLFVLEDGTVIKAVIEPMDTQDRPYSVFCWEKDPGCIFGFGLSYEVADMVDACNSSFRAAMDNLGLSVGPQIVVNSKLIRPLNKRWQIEPNKLWELVSNNADVRQAFAFFQIDSKLTELLGVFDRAKQMIDEVGGPAMAMQGQEAPSYLDTARGIGIAWNASNIWMRRAVRNWDDDVTAPMIQRFVDWNMQYSPKADIKGDFNVICRGVSALLEAEGQNAKMAMFMQAAQGVPMPFAKRIAQLKAYARALRLDQANDMLPDEAETKILGEQIDNQGPPPNMEMERIKMRQAELQDRDMERQHEVSLANLNAQTRLSEIASREGLTREQAQQRYGIELLKLRTASEDKRLDREQQARAMNAELMAKFQLGSGI